MMRPLCLLVLLGLPQGQDAVPVPFRSYLLGHSLYFAAHKEAQVIPVRSEKELRMLSLLVFGDASRMDASTLKTDVMIWIVAGQRSSTGYELFVVGASVLENPPCLQLEVRELSPEASGKGGDPALTYPFALISIPKERLRAEIRLIDGSGKPVKAKIHADFEKP